MIITIDTGLMVSEAAWVAYNDGVQAFLQLRGVSPMRSSESVADALRRASASFVRCTDETIEFSNQGAAEQLLDCLRRSLAAYSPSLVSAAQVEGA